MSRQAKGGLKERTLEKTKICEPRMWKVVALNDDVTPINFVVDLMIRVFDKDPAEARVLTMKIHIGGSGVAGVYPKSIAEAKKMQADALSKSYEFPLTLRLERD